jgi:DNA (cytosine-5)-methyltransferase 1
MGYHQAGFEVVGVDIAPQKRYPFEFIQANVMGLDIEFLRSFDAIHASPPCQAYSKAQRLQKNDHPDLVIPVRRKLAETGLPWVIENVPGAPLFPTITLCGAMFPGLRVYRHRIFASSFTIYPPQHPPHDAPQVKMGRRISQGDFIQVVGNFSGAEYAREAMGCPWMTRDELREAIPPAYTKFIGEQLLASLEEQKLEAA